MFFAKIPRHTRQNANVRFARILTRNCEGTEQLRFIYVILYEISVMFSMFL